MMNTKLLLLLIPGMLSAQILRTTQIQCGANNSYLQIPIALKSNSTGVVKLVCMQLDSASFSISNTYPPILTVINGGAGTPVFVYGETPTGTINGTNKIFTTSNSPLAGSLRVFLNGIRLNPAVDYTISTNTFTLTTAPSTGDSVIVDYNR